MASNNTLMNKLESVLDDHDWDILLQMSVDRAVLGCVRLREWRKLISLRILPNDNGCSIVLKRMLRHRCRRGRYQNESWKLGSGAGEALK